MLYLDTQKAQEDMKALDLQNDIRGVAVCMKRIMKATEGCGKLSSNKTLFSDSWFIRVTTADESNT